MDISKIKSKIQTLIDNGEIKSFDELKDIPIDKIPERFNISPVELLCYMCQTELKRECDNPRCSACVDVRNS